MSRKWSVTKAEKAEIERKRAEEERAEAEASRFSENTIQRIQKIASESSMSAESLFEACSIMNDHSDELFALYHGAKAKVAAGGILLPSDLQEWRETYFKDTMGNFIEEELNGRTAFDELIVQGERDRLTKQTYIDQNGSDAGYDAYKVELDRRELHASIPAEQRVERDAHFAELKESIDQRKSEVWGGESNEV